MISFTQTVVFRGGAYDGKVATVAFDDFKVGLVVNVDGIVYRVRDGVIARAIAKTQTEMKYSAVVMEVVNATQH